VSRALVVVDVQNDFADPGGSLYVSGAAAVVTAVNGLVGAAAAAGDVIVYTQDWHPPSTPHFVTEGGVWPIHCVRDTWGAALHPDLAVAATGERVRKGTGGADGYSGFHARDPLTGTVTSTGLAELLRARAADEVVVVGLATDYCVKATAIDAVEAGFATSVHRDAIAAVDLEAGDGDRAIEEMAAAGVLIR
jgi:nicotinamidase/pyrazinamidase